jgi:hypothetical protein
MLNQILSRTPTYVWVILALLVWRGIVEMRERDMPLRRLYVLPLAMLAWGLYDVIAKFGVEAVPLAAWAAGCAASLTWAWTFGTSRILAPAEAGQVRVRGSRAPLAAMLGLFVVKYVSSVLLAARPEAAHQVVAVVAMCAAFGLFNGWFLGRLVHDVAVLRAQPGQGAAMVHSPAQA